MKRIFLLPVIALVSFTVPNWKIKTETSEVKFKIKNFGAWVDGTLSGLEGSIHFDPSNPGQSTINGSVDVSTINTGNTGRDKHLKNEDFFDVTKYPRMTLKSKSIKKEGNDYVMDADLTIKATTKHISIPFSFTAADSDKGLFKSEFSIDRTEFSLGGTNSPMGTTVKITLFVPVYK